MSYDLIGRGIRMHVPSPSFVNTTTVLIDINQLRVGMYIQLDVGWMHHPFPTSSFKVANTGQIELLRSLGLQQVRYLPAKSDVVASDSPSATPEDQVAQPEEPVAVAPDATSGGLYSIRAKRLASLALLKAQRLSLEQCDQRFADATREYQRLAAKAPAEPRQAREHADTLVASCVADVLDNGDSAIRLLSQGVGVQPALHPVNVMVLSLLLGKALGTDGDGLHGIGVAALLHDLGKQALPFHVAEPATAQVAADRKRYESHVAESVNLAKRMGLPGPVLVAIAQHHEMADGSGFPLALHAEDLSRPGQIVALVNHYDRMCNPLHGASALTPHESLSVIFAQHKARFDAVVLGAFIRMMGVYPPGSVVQLVNDRYALVISVNSARPLRPRVLVHDSRVPKDEALVVDLENVPELGIRRSLRPSQLPRDALDYLSPRQRICYFFERAVDPGPNEATT